MPSQHAYDPHLVDQIADIVCRRAHLSDDECGDFKQDVQLKFIENDHARWRQFGGRSDRKTFLFIAIRRMAIDRFVERQGKWRPSIAAKRLGPIGVELEFMMFREKRPRDEAIMTLLTRNSTGWSEQALLTIANKLKPRAFGRSRAEFGLDSMAADTAADDRTLETEHERLLGAASEKLERAIERLPDEERLIVHMRWWDGFTIARIAKILGIARPYERVGAIVQQLNVLVSEEGLDAGDFRELLE